MALNEQIASKSAANQATAAAPAFGADLARSQASAKLVFAGADLLACLLAGSLQIWTNLLLAQLSGADGRGRSFTDSLVAASEAALIQPGAALQLAALTAMTLAALAAVGLYNRTVWELDEGRRALSAGLIVYVIHGLPADPAGLALHGAAAVLAAFALALALTTLRMAARTAPRLRRAFDRPALLVGGGLDEAGFSLHIRESRGPRETVLARIGVEEFLSLSRQKGGAEKLAQRIGAPLEAVSVVLAPSPAEFSRTEELLQETATQGLSVSLALPSRVLARRRLAPRQIFAGDMTLLDLDQRHNSGAMGRAVKRAFDATAAGAALILLSPVLLGIMAALYWSYGWGASIFFSQKRVGKGRIRFDCLKFRTMAPDAEERLQALLASDAKARAEWDTYQKLSNDPRITPVGHFLRKTSLDELPQLINVLRGEMSLVGPRPIVAPEIKGYVNDAAYYENPEFDAYAELRPGVTGLWQVSGRASTAYSERMRLDAWYAANWSLWLDVLIVLKTARAAILGGGAG